MYVDAEELKRYIEYRRSAYQLELDRDYNSPLPEHRQRARYLEGQDDAFTAVLIALDNPSIMFDQPPLF